MGVIYTLTTNYIYDIVQKKIKKSKTRDPFVIAEESGVNLRFNPNLVKLKGMYTILRNRRIIVINSNLPEYMQKIVCAHELGHDALHQTFARSKALQEFMLYDMTSRPEYEANIFAAELLLDDEELFELFKEGHDAQQLAGILNTDINLVALKIASLNYRGYNLRNSVEPRSNFLRY